MRLADRHLPISIRQWMGDSVGHWEGDTLVVETTNMRPEQGLFAPLAQPRITERFTRVAPSKILYRFTVEDPGSTPSPAAARWP